MYFFLNFDSSNVAIESVKMEDQSDEEVEIKHEMESIDDDDDSDNNDDDDDDINVAIDQSVIKEEENRSAAKCPSRISNDVSEGKTIFLKNVPFSVKNDELKKYMEQFGPIYYALVCIDPLTEYSKGTAFVKFKVRFLTFCTFFFIVNITIDTSNVLS